MKSLAHPEWPYLGTPHEWRVRDIKRDIKRDNKGRIKSVDNTPVANLSIEEFNERFPSYDAKYLHKFY